MLHTNTQCSTSGQFEHAEQDTLPVPPSSPSQSVLCSDSQFQFEPPQHSTPIKKRKITASVTPSKKIDGTATQTSPSMKCYYLTKDHTTKLTPGEEKIATYVMKRKFSLPKDNIAKLKTGGQSLHLVKVAKARKSSL